MRKIVADESILWPGILVCWAEEGFFCATNCEEAFACETWLRGLRDAAEARLDAFSAQCRRMGLELGGDHFSRGVAEGMAEIIAARERETARKAGLGKWR